MPNQGSNGEPANDEAADSNNVPLSVKASSSEQPRELSGVQSPQGRPLGDPLAESEPSIPFTNDVIDPVDLPRLSAEEFESVHPNHLKVRWIGDAIFAAMVIVGAIVALVIAPIPKWIPVVAALALLALTALAAALQKLEVEKLGYQVRERDFSFREGVIFTNVKTMPYARVQHVSIDRGPVERMFGLATLTMKSAGGDIRVGGLPPEVADRLKALVVDRSGASADSELAYGDGSQVENPLPTAPAVAPDSDGDLQ